MQDPLEEHVSRLYRFALRLTNDPDTAQDIAQETFLKAWRHRRRLRNPQAARVWLFRIAVNLWRDQLRRKRIHDEKMASLQETLNRTENQEPQDPMDQDDIQLVIRAMDSLPSRQRQVLYLHALESLSPGEISKILGISENAARSSLSHARRAMRRILNDLL